MCVCVCVYIYMYIYKDIYTDTHSNSTEKRGRNGPILEKGIDTRQ